MTAYGEHPENLWPFFDSYVKKVIRSRNNEFGRQRRAHAVEIPTDDPTLLNLMNSLGQGRLDQYPSEGHEVIIVGHTYPMVDDALYEAICQLPEDLTDVLIYRYWMGYTDKQTAKIMHTSLKTCYNRRKKALTMLRKMIEEAQNEQQMPLE